MELFVGDGGTLGGGTPDPSWGLLTPSWAPEAPMGDSSSLDIVELHSEATVRLDSGRSENKNARNISQNIVLEVCINRK